ncbi:uncharacterized protein LOC143911993 [Arctopsyche grandis]|uniref:uncharacterized protein LOC143911993 n=1 Tax=Arctopsyche grandis TaxID=121162 RepID=UPI00406D7E63
MAPDSISQGNQLVQPSTTTTVEDFFRGQNVFITGGSGFVGKVLIEKLLWACESVGNLYILIRPSKGCSVNQRIEDIIKLPLFDRLRERDAGIFKKIKPIAGDMSKPNLAIDDADRKLLENSVSIVFHIACSVRFDDPLKKAIFINLRGTKYIMDIAENMKNLKVMLYISTTFCNTDKKEVEEKVYLSNFNWRDMIKLAETCDDHTLNILTKKILDKQPNTYTYTKFLAENLIYDYSKHLPCAIFRPSIVTYTTKEPMPGWVDNLNGPMGMATGVFVGILHVIYGDEDLINDYIPCDYVINGIIVAAWYKGISNTKECIVINGANGGKKQIPFTSLVTDADDVIRKCPPFKALWYPSVIMTKKRYVYLLMTLFTQIIPGFLLDMLQGVTKSKYQMMRIYRKIYVANEAVAYFMLNEWKFDTKNYDSVCNFLTPNDAKVYNYNTSTLNQKESVLHGVYAVKRFILKEDMSVEANIASKKRFQRSYWLHRALTTVFWFFVILIGSTVLMISSNNCIAKLLKLYYFNKIFPATVNQENTSCFFSSTEHISEFSPMLSNLYENVVTFELTIDCISIMQLLNISQSIQLVQPSTTTTVEDFFRGQNVFITGGSGFVGKVLIEKLLWACESVGNLYLLIRTSKGCSANQRIEDIIKLPLFDRLRERDAGIFKKIKPIAGDISEPNLGISDADRKLLENSVNIVFHAASCVRFDDPLKKAVLINLRGTKYIMDIVENMKNLKVMLYISTTFCNADKKEVEEKVYLSNFNWRDMIKLAETCDDHTLNILTKKILDKQPNTYTYTKFLAENLIYDYSKHLPCAIFRPSIVMYTAKEPMPGWIDNLNGPMGMVTGVFVGILHVIYGDEDLRNDCIPCDYVINGIIVAAWYKGISNTKECIVINGANGRKKVIYLSNLMDTAQNLVAKSPPYNALWYPSIIPGFLLDMLQSVTKSKYQMMRIYRKIYVANEAVAYFMLNEWKFDTKNYDSIRNFLTPNDAKVYNYNMDTFDDNEFILNGPNTIKKYILKEELTVEAITASKIRLHRSYLLHQTLKTLFYFLEGQTDRKLHQIFMEHKITNKH